MDRTRTSPPVVRRPPAGTPPGRRTVVALAAVCVAGCATLPAHRRGADVPRWRRVTPQFWVGGQPSRVGLQQLRHRGVDTVISVRNHHAAAVEEAAVCRALGLRFLSLPLAWHGAPDPDQSRRIIHAIETANDAGQTVFVHCQWGRDRTGAIIALYRLTHDHWPLEQALTEARDHHVVALTWSLRRWLEAMRSLSSPAG